MEVQQGICAGDCEKKDTECGRCDSDCVRSAGDDPFHAAGVGGAGVSAGADHPIPGDADEVRDRDVREVQHRGSVCVQGRPGVLPGATEAAAAGILKREWCKTGMVECWSTVRLE